MSEELSFEENRSKSAIDIIINEHKCFEKSPDESFVTCNVCRINVKTPTREGGRPLRLHLATKRHSDNKYAIEKNKNFLLLSNEQFNENLCLAHVATNTPLSRLEDPIWRDLYENSCGRTIYTSAHFRQTIVPRLSKKIRKKSKK